MDKAQLRNKLHYSKECYQNRRKIEMSPFQLFKKHSSVSTFFKNLYHVDSSSGYKFCPAYQAVLTG